MTLLFSAKKIDGGEDCPCCACLNFASFTETMTSTKASNHYLLNPRFKHLGDCTTWPQVSAIS